MRTLGAYITIASFGVFLALCSDQLAALITPYFIDFSLLDADPGTSIQYTTFVTMIIGALMYEKFHGTVLAENETLLFESWASAGESDLVFAQTNLHVTITNCGLRYAPYFKPTAQPTVIPFSAIISVEKLSIQRARLHIRGDDSSTLSVKLNFYPWDLRTFLRVLQEQMQMVPETTHSSSPASLPPP